MPELPPNFALTMGPLNVKITYYYEGGALDVDNMQKPILDALEGIVYDDDGCVTDVAGRKRDINGRFRVRGMSPSLARAFAQGSEFVHVVVEIQTDHESL